MDYYNNIQGMNTYEKIGQIVKKLRTERRLSQEELSAQCSIDQHYIINIECGQRNVSIDILERISSFFGMSLSQFFTCVESIDDIPYCPSSVISAESLEGEFVRFMRAQRLSERTINKYSADTPKSPSVQRIIKDVTGYTDNMYNVRDIELLDKIIAKVSASEFDQIGHSMYSAGLKKYILFLESGEFPEDSSSYCVIDSIIVPEDYVIPASSPNIVFQYLTYKKIPGTKKTYREDSPNTNTKTQRHIHVFYNGKQLYAINFDGTPHDGSKCILSKPDIAFLKELGVTVPKNGILECLVVRAN